MGEPLDNFDNFVKAVEIFSELDGLAISRRRQTVSTSGIASKIKKLGEKDLQIQLAISLHAVDDELRSELIPMNKAYNIASIIEAVKEFPVDTRKIVRSEKYTVCISSQVGCKVGCSFCLTARGGFVRNLTVGEYIAQIVHIKRDNGIAENG